MIYFASDVHLGLRSGDPREREERFVSWLKSLRKPDTEALYLLGDIWDFWYEYRDVIPREGIRVVAAIVGLLDSGVKVYYFPGNHDVWLYSFWQSLGVRVLSQPHRCTLGGKRFLLGHGDALGGASRGYRFMLKIFNSRICRALFSSLHPRLAFGLANCLSARNRGRHTSYKFRGKDEPLYKFCAQSIAAEPADFCIFGHFHDSVDLPLEGGSRLIVLKDWLDAGTPFASWDGQTLLVSR